MFSNSSVRSSNNTLVGSWGTTAISSTDLTNSTLSDGTITARNIFRLDDNVTVQIGDDFSMSAKILKTCLKTVLALAMKERPEDFV